jgi:adenylate kinase
MRIILMGPPGAGKGTAAESLIKHYQIPHISTGNIFRELYKDRTKVGKIAKEYIERGELVPDDITNEIVRHRLSHDDVKKGFLFDGYPRNVEQAKALDEMLAKKGWTLSAAINFSAPDEVIIKRISGRRVCELCGTVYHVTNKKPKVSGICDHDQGRLIHRNDDMEGTVKRRLKIYYHHTEPVIGYYKDKNLLITVDGTQSIDAIDQTLKKVLGDKCDSN